MTWASLAAVLTATRCEFTKALADRHYFVRTSRGRWSRTLDAPPKDAIHVSGRIYRMPDRMPKADR